MFGYASTELSRFLDDVFDPVRTYRDARTNHDEENYYIEILAPGLSKDDITIDESSGKLIITLDYGDNSLFGTGKGTYSYRVGDLIDLDKLTAKLEDGILKITIPRKEKAEKRQFLIE